MVGPTSRAHLVKAVSLLIIAISVFSSCLGMKLSFCDGEKLVTIKGNECPGGINFGDRKPDCVCLNGIYRMWLDNCDLYDGFMEEGCTTLTQEEWTVMGMRFAGKVGPLANSTAAIYGKEDSETKAWTAHQVGSNGTSNSDNFYILNGDVSLMISEDGTGKQKKFICIEKQIKEVDQICRYYRNEEGNANETWLEEDGALEIVVLDSCRPEQGFRKVELSPENCYGILNRDDSECSLSCVKAQIPSTSRTIDPLLISSDELATNNLLRRSLNSSVEDTLQNLEDGILVEKDKTHVSNYPFQLPPNFDDIDETNFTKLTVTQQMNANNFFLNRKLNHYSKLRQVGYLQPNDLRQIKPQRTFELLELVRDISKRACADRYVSSLFIDQAVDLFVILHKGRNYRYSEDLGEDDFSWMRKILTSCLIDTHELEMIPEQDEFSMKCEDFQKVKGVCYPGSQYENCTDISLSENHGTFGKFHFVVEAVWDLIDLAQIVCFPSFTESYRMFHQWEQASEKLFTREISKLWYNPSISMKVYQNLLTPSAQIDMFNLEMCVEGAYALNPALTRLNRPSEPRRFFRRKKRDVTSLKDIKSYDVYCRKTEEEFEFPC